MIALAVRQFFVTPGVSTVGNGNGGGGQVYTLGTWRVSREAVGWMMGDNGDVAKPMILRKQIFWLGVFGSLKKSRMDAT